MGTKRLGIFVFLVAGCAAILSAQAPVQFTVLPGVYNTYSAQGNLVYPIILSVDRASQGNFLTFMPSGVAVYGVVPSSVNPAPSQVGVLMWTTASFSGYSGALQVLDNDLHISSSVAVNTAGPGTWLATDAYSTVEPVSSATGELFKPDLPADLALGGPLPLEFRRYYGSLIGANGITSRIGNNWMHNFEWLLVHNGPFVEVIRPGAKSLLFQQTGNTWQLALPERAAYQLFVSANSTFQFFDPETNHIYTFVGTGNTIGLSKIQDRSGNILTVTADTSSTQISDGLGRVLTITYDSNNRVVKVADQTGRSVSYAYTGSDLTQFTDANGNAEQFTYTTSTAMNGLMTAETLPLGNKPYTQTWNALGQVTGQTDSRGNATALTYDAASGSTTIKDPLAVTMSHTSRQFSDFSGLTDTDGNKLAVSYDTKGHRAVVTDRLGNKITLTFDGVSGNVATATDANGNVTAYSWQSQNAGIFIFYVLAKIQYADGTSMSYTYDALGNLLTATDQAGKIWKFTYTNRGLKTSETDPLGRVVKYAYNSDGTVASVTDAAGNATNYSYDALKRVNLVTYADGTTESTTYDAMDHVLTRVHGSGTSTAFVYNANGKVKSTTEGTNPASTIAYSTDEQAAKTTDRTGASTSYTYNALGLNDSITAPAGEKLTFRFDSHHRLQSALDPAGNGTTYGYDKEDGLASTTDALSRKTLYTTDGVGSLTQATTPSGAKYTITRDKLTRPVSIADPTGISRGATLDARGLPSTLTIGNLSSTLAHDDSGALSGITDPNGNSWSFGFDASGHLTTKTDPLRRVTTFSFDKRNREAGAQTPLGTVALTRDADGNVLRRLYSDGTDLNYTVAYGGDVTSGPGLAFAFDAEHRMTGSNGLTIVYDADGRIASITYASGKTVTYKYNALGLLDSVTDWLGGVTKFSYNAAHELIAMKRPNGLSTQYTRNVDGFVTGITDDSGLAIALQLDAAGKPLSETRTQPQAPAIAPGVLALSFDAADQVSGSTYDAMGRVTADGFRSYTWNLASELTAYTGVDGSATAGYDGFGMRNSQTTSAGARNFVWNYATGLPTAATVQAASGDLRYYIYTPEGALLYAIDTANNNPHYYHFDQNGSTVLLTDAGGAITDSYGVTPYGETVTHSGTTENPFTWLGQWGVMQEGSTRLFYMRARYYDSATARFISPDPRASADPQEVNPYQYARENPNTFSDPTGLSPEEEDDDDLEPESFELRTDVQGFLLEYINKQSLNPVWDPHFFASGHFLKPSRAHQKRRFGSSDLTRGVVFGSGELSISTYVPPESDRGYHLNLDASGLTPLERILALRKASVPATGTNPVGINPVGINPVGINPVGINPGGFAPGSGYGILTKRPKPESLIGNPEGVHHGCWININTGKVIFSTPTGADLFGGNYFQYEDPCVTAPAMGR